MMVESCGEYVEFIGYLGSVLCAVSLMMKDIKKLRWLNLVASAILVAYSVFKNAGALVVTNAIIVLIDIYYIIKIYKEERK